MPQNERDIPVKSVHTAFTLVERIMKMDGASVTELAEDLSLPKSTVSDYLVTLRRNQYLIKRNNRYYIGLRFLELGDYARNYRSIYDVAKRNVSTLANDTGELVHLSVEENGRGVIIHEIEGKRAVSLDTYIGRRVPLYCTALGKAILAEMSEKRAKKIIDDIDFESKTSRTITTRDELYEELKRVDELGYAISVGERISNLGSVAVPISSGGLTTGAISVCCPMSRIEEERLEREIPRKLSQAADRIELDLQYQS